MITVKVKAPWQGKVALRDKYINEALSTGQGLLILMDNAYMEVPAEAVKGSIVGRSKEKYLDKFSGMSHYLIYFNWKPKVSPLPLWND